MRLTSSDVAKIFPIFFIVDRGLQCVEVSQSLGDLVPNLGVDSSLCEALEIQRPAIPELSYAAIADHQRSKFLFHVRGNPGLTLDGQFISIEEGPQDHLLFLGRPMASRVSDLTRFGVRSGHFGVHDYALDLLVASLRDETMRRQLALRSEELNYQSRIGSFALDLLGNISLGALYMKAVESALEVSHLDGVALFELRHGKFLSRATAGCLASLPADELDRSAAAMLGEIVSAAGRSGEVKPVGAEVLLSGSSSLDSSDWQALVVPVRHQGACLGALSFIASAQVAIPGVLIKSLEAAADLLGGAIHALELSNALNERVVARATALESRDLALRSSAHEVRTPLAQLQTSVEVLRIQAKRSREQQIVEGLESLAEPLERLSKYSLAMLLQTQPGEEEGEQLIHVQPSQFELSAFVSEMLTSLARAVGRERDVRLHGPSEAVSVETDISCVAQVVSNLITNALKYSAAGSSVDLEIRDTGDWCRVTVADSGIGIPQDIAGLVFEPFVRHPDATATSPGVGVGLSIARTSAEAIGGHLSFSSVVGRGSRFVLEFPRVLAV